VNTTTLAFNPGVYCYGIDGDSGTIQFNASPTTSACNNQPGCYIIVGGDFSAHGTTNQTGTGVTFILTGTSTWPFGIGGGGGEPFGISMDHAGGYSQLSAPTSGTYAGILFYQDPNATPPSGQTIEQQVSYIQRSAGGSYFTGALYFPDSILDYCASGLTCDTQTGGYTIIDAYQVNLAGTISWSNNYSTLPNGSPIKNISVLGE
jgi:hypothetical protein